MIWFCWPSHHPTPGNIGLQITEKMTILFSIVLRREGGRVEFFPFKLLLEVFLNNFFKIAAFSNITCTLQKHTIEVIKRICGSPRTGGVTITPPWPRLCFPFQHKFWVLEAPLMKSFSSWTRLITNYLKKKAFLLASSGHDAKLLNYEESGPYHSGQWAERWLMDLRDLWGNDLLALRRMRQMDSLYWWRCSKKGPFNFKFSSHCAVNDGEEIFMYLGHHRWSDIWRQWTHGMSTRDFFRCSRT